MRRSAGVFVTARGCALRAVAVAILLLTSVALPAPTAYAHHGTCNSYRSHVGAERNGGGGYGARATIEWDHAGVCDGYTYSFSTTWAMSSGSSGLLWVQAGWTNDVGEPSTRVYYQYTDANGKPYDDFYANQYGTGGVTFAVYRNFLFSTNRWCFSASGHEFACTKPEHNMNWPKDAVEFAAETNRTTNRLYGSTGDPVTFSHLGYRDGNRVWHATTGTCVRHSNLGRDELFSHYRGCTPEGAVKETFSIYDDRR